MIRLYLSCEWRWIGRLDQLAAGVFRRYDRDWQFVCTHVPHQRAGVVLTHIRGKQAGRRAKGEAIPGMPRLHHVTSLLFAETRMLLNSVG